MFEVPMIQWVTERILSMLGPISQLQKEKREITDSALRAISIALDETCIYYRGLNSGKARDTETENQLCKYWSAAAIPVRHIDMELANICEFKSEYWLDPDHWGEHNEENKVLISLDKVRAKYRRHLNKGRVTANEA